MSHREEDWAVGLAAAAEADFDRIVEWTSRQFGTAQAGAYAETLLATVDALLAGPDTIGVRARNDLGAGVFSLHAARRGRARHIVVFRCDTGGGRKSVRILRILHDAMELRRHLPPDADDEDI